MSDLNARLPSNENELNSYLKFLEQLGRYQVYLKTAAEYSKEGILSSLESDQHPDIFLYGIFDDMYIKFADAEMHHQLYKLADFDKLDGIPICTYFKECKDL